MGAFGKSSDPTPPTPPQTSGATVIGTETSFVGEIKGSRPVRVEGRIKGTVDISSSLEIARGATVEAEVRATSVRISGQLTGNVEATELVELLATASITGDITTPSLHVIEGAEVDGRVTMKSAAKGRPRAVPAPAKS